jgi:hypothetical protein
MAFRAVDLVGGPVLGQIEPPVQRGVRDWAEIS